MHEDLPGNMVSQTMSRQAKVKNGHPPKVCARCGLAFEWRKKWERDWDQVRYCSEKCKRSSPARKL